MLAEWFGDEEGSFFDFDSIAKNRRMKYPMLPDELANLLQNNQNVRIRPKQHGERRILSADIALMSSTKHNNDASAVFINQMSPTKAGRYTNNIVYGAAYEGLHTEDQALTIRKLYDQYDCDYIVLDTNGEIQTPLYTVTYIEKRERNGKAVMLIRVEGCVQKHSHTQRIGAEPAMQNIMRPRVRAVWRVRRKDMLSLRESRIARTAG